MLHSVALTVFRQKRFIVWEFCIKNANHAATKVNLMSLVRPGRLHSHCTLLHPPLPPWVLTQTSNKETMTLCIFPLMHLQHKHVTTWQGQVCFLLFRPWWSMQHCSAQDFRSAQCSTVQCISDSYLGVKSYLMGEISWYYGTKEHNIYRYCFVVKTKHSLIH